MKTFFSTNFCISQNFLFADKVVSLRSNKTAAVGLAFFVVLAAIAYFFYRNYSFKAMPKGENQTIAQNIQEGEPVNLENSHVDDFLGKQAIAPKIQLQDENATWIPIQSISDKAVVRKISSLELSEEVQEGKKVQSVANDSDKMPIFIRTLSGGYLTCNVCGSMTVALLAEEICKATTDDFHQFVLSFEGTPLSYSKSLAYYYIKGESIIHCQPISSMMQIFIHRSYKGTLTLDVFPWMTIEAVKEKVYQREKKRSEIPTPINIMGLKRGYGGGVNLDCSKTLADYGIQKEATLTLATNH